MPWQPLRSPTLRSRSKIRWRWPTARRWSWLRGYPPRSQTAQPWWTRAPAAGNAVHGVTAQVGHSKDTRPGTGSLRLAEPPLPRRPLEASPRGRRQRRASPRRRVRRPGRRRRPRLQGRRPVGCRAIRGERSLCHGRTRDKVDGPEVDRRSRSRTLAIFQTVCLACAQTWVFCMPLRGYLRSGQQSYSAGRREEPVFSHHAL